MPSKKPLASSSNIVGLAALWMTTVSSETTPWGVTPASVLAAGASPQPINHEAYFSASNYFLRPEDSVNTASASASASVDINNISSKSPQFDMFETPDGVLHLTLEIPDGLSANDLRIEFLEDEHAIRISSTNNMNSNDKSSSNKQPVQLEEVTIPLDHTVLEVERLQATLEDGTLDITVPRKKKSTKMKKKPPSKTSSRSKDDVDPNDDKEEEHAKRKRMGV